MGGQKFDAFPEHEITPSGRSVDLPDDEGLPRQNRDYLNSSADC